MSPERVRSDAYAYPADIWAYGVALAEAACGRFPFGGNAFEVAALVADGMAAVDWEGEEEHALKNSAKSITSRLVRWGGESN